MRSRLGYGLLFLAISISGFAGSLCKLTVVFDHAPKASRDFSRLLQKAEAGNPNAQFQVGLAYEAGTSVEQDHIEAARWYQKAADRGNSAAQNNLGSMYGRGLGVPQSDSEAMKWLRRAADQNNAVAQCNLGDCYHEGHGVANDEVEAYAWHNLAATTSKEAAKHRDALVKTMSPKQVADGQKRTEELRAQIEAKLKSGGTD